MTNRRRLIVVMLGVVVGGVVLGVRFRHRPPPVNPWLSPAEDAGDFAGPLVRAAVVYDPSKLRSRPWVDPAKTAPLPTRYHTFRASSINGAETDYLLYLPPGYDEPGNAQRRYPVVYWLHGYDSEPQDGLPFVEGIDAAIRRGDAPAMIVVLPNGLKDGWSVDSANVSQPVESVFIRDLIPHVDSTYRTIADRRGRAVEGFSMGGWGALHLAFKYPELFAAVTAVSAPFHRHDRFWQLGQIFGGDASAYYAEDPVTRARREPASLRDVRIRLICGEKDQLGHLAYNQMFDKRLTQWGIAHEMAIVPGVNHNAGDIYQAMGANAFKFYTNVFGR
ncbi:MAG: putative esterase [Phycisphaerales bacterium]|nr:putative esterase [Phycisphaerales bacterium]